MNGESMEPEKNEYAVLARKGGKTIVLDVETYSSDYQPFGWEDVGRIMLTSEDRAAGDVMLEIERLKQ